MAADEAVREIVWMRDLLKELEIHQEATALHQDNTGSIALAKNPVYHSKTKHICIRFHYIRELVNQKLIQLVFVPTENMLADVLTKAVYAPLF
jgi:hypothetical protein